MSTPDAKSPRLHPTVITLGWVSFFSDVSSEMAYPLIPLFVTSVLGATTEQLGAIEGVAVAVVALLTGYAGWRSDRSERGIARRVPWVRWGYGLPVAGKLIVAAAVAWPMVLAGRAIDRLGKGLRGSPRDALIADATSPENRCRAFGFHRAMDTAGAFVGVLISAGVLALFETLDSQTLTGSVRTILYAAAAMGLASFLCTFFVREAAEPDSPPRAAHSSPSSTSVPPAATDPSPAALPRAYWCTLIPLLIFALGNSTDTFILLRASDLGLSPTAVVLAYALYNLIFTIVSYPAGVLADRIGKWRTIAIGWLIYADAYLGFAITGPTGLWPLLALYGTYAALTEGVGKALIANLAPPGRRGAALGIFAMGGGLMMLAASLIAGVLWHRVGPEAPFCFGAATAAVAAACIPAAHWLTRQTTRPPAAR